MDFNVEVRLKQLESLDQFISSSRDKVNSILNCIGWTEEKVLKDVSMIKCSVDSSHRVPVNSIDKHIEKCSLKSEGYLLDEHFLSEPVNDPKSSIMVDDFEKMKIIAEARKNQYDFKTGWNGQDPAPKTVDRNIATYSSDERLAFYDYSIKRTKGPPELPEFNVYSKPSVENKPLTYEEKLAQIRDAKRRRIKYRSVHTNRKNHTEVMREVIESQMELYKEWLAEGDTPKEKETKKNSSHPSDKLKELEELSDKSSDYHSSIRSKSSNRSFNSKGASNHNCKNNDEHKHKERKSRRDENYSRDHRKSHRSDSRKSYHKERSRRSRDRSRDRSHHRKRYS